MRSQNMRPADPKPSVAVILLIFEDSMSQLLGSINEIDELEHDINRIKNKVQKNTK